MTGHLRAFVATPLLAALPTLAQHTHADVLYWVGEGNDSTVLVIDFNEGTLPAFAFGFIHDGAANAIDAVNAIAAVDPNFRVEMNGNFLNSLWYGPYAGVGGAPDYWGTWDGGSYATLGMNGGMATPLIDGGYFGMLYFDFSEGSPRVPVPAYDPYHFTADDVMVWAGEGSDSALVVIDFHGTGSADAFAWGVLFNDSITGEGMLEALVAVDPRVAYATASGFLNDITFGDHAGLGGDPDYWSTWSGTNMGDIDMNMGIGTYVHDRGLFAFSYTDFNPALRPRYPVAADRSTAVVARSQQAMQVWPQPATDILNVRLGSTGTEPFTVFNLGGARMQQGFLSAGQAVLDVSAWPAGMYVFHSAGVQRLIAVQ